MEYREVTININQAQIIKDNIHKNSKRVDHEYKVGDKVMLDNNADLNTRYHINSYLI